MNPLGFAQASKLNMLKLNHSKHSFSDCNFFTFQYNKPQIAGMSCMYLDMGSYI